MLLAQNSPAYTPQNGKTDMVVDLGSGDNGQPLKPDIFPEYLYGDSLFLDYVESKIIKSVHCLENISMLSLKLRFVVDTKGNARKITIVDSCKVCPEFEKEICRIITEAPIWRPAMVGGHFVTGYKTMEINCPHKFKGVRNSNLYNQTDSSSYDELPIESESIQIYSKVESVPHFPGGDSAFIEFIKNNFNYPSACLEAGITGDIQIKMIVNIRGIASNFEVIKSVANCPDFDAEAIRLLQSGPNWIPGMVNGKFVTSYHTLTMHIGLE